METLNFLMLVFITCASWGTVALHIYSKDLDKQFKD